MHQKYSKALIKSNIILGIHSLIKGILVLLLFIILYSVIWVQEKYLNYIKVSVYIQLLIFLFLIVVILITNNPRFFDICLNFYIYIFLMISILQIAVIVLESFGIIKNFKLFTKFFHECPYYRSYNDVIESKFQRSCLLYNEDTYSDEQYKYICFYNSEEEYYNKYCDGLLCKKNNNFYEDENDFVKCTGININLITFPENNIYFKKEKLLFEKKKNKRFYLCSRKKRLEDNYSDSENTNNKYYQTKIECPDNNPSKKYIVFIYIEIILHIIADLFFIFEFNILKNLNTIYFKINRNSQIVIPTNPIISQRNTTNNRVNLTSVNRVIINKNRKKATNNYNDNNSINIENDEDKKIENSSENNEEDNIDKNNNINNKKNEDNDNNIITRRTKLKIIENNEINNNGCINIININQNIKICKNNNSGSLLINANKSPKKKILFKSKKYKENENDIKTTENEECEYSTIKRHVNLKSSQLKPLININNNDNIEEHNSSYDESDTRRKIDKNNIINEINKDSKRLPKINKAKLFGETLNKVNTNFNTNNNLDTIDNKKEISKNNNNYENSLKNLLQRTNQLYNLNKYKQQNFDGKKNKIEENKSINNNYINKNDNKTNKKNLIKNMHINSEFFLNDEELENREKEKNNKKQKNEEKQEDIKE